MNVSQTDLDVVFQSDKLSINTVQKIAAACDEETAALMNQNLLIRRSSLLRFCAPEMHEDKCWQAAHETLLLTLARSPNKEIAEIWTTAQEKRQELLSI